MSVSKLQTVKSKDAVSTGQGHCIVFILRVKQSKITSWTASPWRLG